MNPNKESKKKCLGKARMEKGESSTKGSYIDLEAELLMFLSWGTKKKRSSTPKSTNQNAIDKENERREATRQGKQPVKEKKGSNIPWSSERVLSAKRSLQIVVHKLQPTSENPVPRSELKVELQKLIGTAGLVDFVLAFKSHPALVYKDGDLVFSNGESLSKMHFKNSVNKYWLNPAPSMPLSSELSEVKDKLEALVKCNKELQTSHETLMKEHAELKDMYLAQEETLKSVLKVLNELKEKDQDKNKGKERAEENQAGMGMENGAPWDWEGGLPLTGLTDFPSTSELDFVDRADMRVVNGADEGFPLPSPGFVTEVVQFYNFGVQPEEGVNNNEPEEPAE